jgi:hypothetical protein
MEHMNTHHASNQLVGGHGGEMDQKGALRSMDESTTGPFRWFMVGAIGRST